MTKHARHRVDLLSDDLPVNLPGADLIAAGLAALERGERTKEALLVALGAPRLRDIGLEVPRLADRITEPNLELYARVRQTGGDHFDYNALLGRLSSFADAAEWLLRDMFRHQAGIRTD